MTSVPTPAPEDFVRAQGEERFQNLRKHHRSFAFPMTVFFLAWYLLYVVFAAFLPDFMSIKVVGNINLGLVWGLLQFVSTFVITSMYVSHANKKIDPEAAAIREELELAALNEARAAGRGNN
ncbi:MAG: DUF485 domain-containing protein [Galactobacter sp.]|uniref:DUF485 domain-containing protein n=1 Tax=Galactobacter sp. TaxID=2676125 RepID=UPI0025C1262B|nr:DUF485 domain-containing protein [Galactobacter sp.]